MKSQFIVTASTILAAIILNGCANQHDHPQRPQQSSSKVPELPQVPASLQAPTGQILTLALQATGVQIYECGRNLADDTKLTWNFKSPEAELFDMLGIQIQAGKKIGKHYGGPTWEGSDGSKVVGQVKASENSADPASISWLLLSAKANSGSGIFAKTVSIQRLNTVGGKPPAGGCDATHIGNLVRVPYSAQYYFYN
jgi:hypothetical protein